MTKRPPFLGYNHNVRHKGRLFHVQTEDSGLSRPVLTTHVFVEGTILATLRAQYTVEEPDAVVQKRMQEQHKTMLKRVRDGEFDSGSEAVAKPAAEAAPARAEAAPESGFPDSAQATHRISVVGGAAAPPANAAAKKAPPPPPPRGNPGLSERQTAELQRPGSRPPAGRSGESTQELAPVQKSTEAGGLAARLGIGPAVPQGVVPPPIAGAAAMPPSVVSMPSTPLDEDDIEPVVEMELPPPVDDDEPGITIEAAEPTEAEAEAAELSKATPLPAAMPLGHDETFIMGAEELIPPPRVGPFTVSVPTGPASRPVRGTRPVAARPLHSGALRARATSEGVVVLCLGPARNLTRRRPPNPNDPLRLTQPHLHPTPPSPLSITVSSLPGEDGAFDEKIMSFLRREAARAV